MAWLDVLTAHDKLDYARDRDQLRAVVRADAAGRLTTWPLAVIRHAKARPRGSWTPPDPERPLDERGQAQAEAIVPLLAAYGGTGAGLLQLGRCADTLRLHAAAAGLRLRLTPRRGMRPTRPAAPTTCAGSSNAVRRRPCAAMARVLPSVLESLQGMVDDRADDGPDATRVLGEAASDGMAKGSAVCHVVDTGEAARVTAVERYPI